MMVSSKRINVFLIESKLSRSSTDDAVKFILAISRPGVYSNEIIPRLEVQGPG